MANVALALILRSCAFLVKEQLLASWEGVMERAGSSGGANKAGIASTPFHGISPDLNSSSTAQIFRKSLVEAAGSPQRCRVTFYSHDTMGLGHLRRNLLAANAIACSPLRAVTLLVAGVREATAFALPPSADCLTLPALRKRPDGKYEARTLAVSLTDLIAVRARVIRAAIEAFEPDVLIVDNVPRGALLELEPTLHHLRAGGRTKCVLGLRDVLDEPDAMRREWSRLANEEAIKQFYHEVWVYSDPAVYNAVSEYQLSPELASKVRFIGYLDQRARLGLSSENGTCSPDLRPGRFVLCGVGGGQDGALLAEAFVRAQLPAHTEGVLLAGPFMDKQYVARLCQLAAGNLGMRILEFCTEPVHLVRDASRVIMMGGYNSACEVLSFEKPALIIPRVEPRAEQLIRAQRLHSMGLVDLLHPRDLTPALLSQWMAQDRPRPQVHGRVDFNGLSALPVMLRRLLDSPVHQIAQGAV
jgi:predicted glycosyltransferase